ncbi:MAG: ATP-binding cassette domain-containing protein, partial [Bdellovibrionia bacterium]
TLLGLLSRLHKPNEGKIFFDGVDAESLSTSNIRSQLGVVLQKSHLFSGDLLSNIALADSAPDVERAAECARISGADEFISKYPAGLKHHLGESGLGLSEGQRQRLSFARALYARPKIMLLDEATSSLDATSEKILVERMRAVLTGKTAILTAHRLSTLRLADRTVLLKDGKLIEDGTHEELLRRSGHYRELLGN